MPGTTPLPAAGHHTARLSQTSPYRGTAGSGTAVCLLQGAPETRTGWRKQTGFLAGPFTVVAPDVDDRAQGAVDQPRTVSASFSGPAAVRPGGPSGLSPRHRKRRVTATRNPLAGFPGGTAAPRTVLSAAAGHPWPPSRSTSTTSVSPE
jgi:hypothetical protein